MRKINHLNPILDAIIKILTIFFIASFSLGGFLLFIYFLRIQFNSGGISAADTVSFTLLAFGFIGTIIFVLLFTTIAGFPIARFGTPLIKISCLLWGKLHKFIFRSSTSTLNFNNEIGNQGEFEWKKGHNAMLWSGVILLLFFTIILYPAPSDVKKFLFVMLATGFIFSFFVFGRPVEIRGSLSNNAGVVGSWVNRLSRPAREFLVCLFILISMLSFVIGTAQDTSMLIVGYRKHDVNVRVTREEFVEFVSHATRLGLVVNPCEPITTTGNVLRHVDVLWHKLGVHGLLRFPSQPLGANDADERPPQQFRQEVKNETLSVQDKEYTRNRCEEIMSDGLFEPANGKLTNRGKKSFEQTFSWLANSPADRQVRITAHNLQPLVREQNSKSSETWLQAASLKQFFMEKFKLQSAQIEIFGLEGAARKQICEEPSEHYRQKCESTNRRIEVLVYS